MSLSHHDQSIPTPAEFRTQAISAAVDASQRKTRATMVTHARLLRRLICAWLLALGSKFATANDSWDSGASSVFRHVDIPIEITPTAMLQDSQGLIWIASQTGLANWDGYHFHSFLADASKPNSLPSSYVNALYQDSLNRLWIGTDSGGLARLDKATGHFSSIAAGSGGLSSTRVFALAPDGEGGLWIGTNNGLDRLDLATDQVQRHADFAAPLGLPSHRVGAVVKDRASNLWVGTLDGLYVLRAGANTFKSVKTDASGASAIEVQRLMEDGAGRIWLGTRTTGAFVIEPNGTIARQVHDSERNDGKGLEADWVATIVDAGNNQVWLGTWAQGLVQVNTHSWTTRRVRHDPTISGSLARDDVTAMLRDRSGLVWAAGPSLLDSNDPAQKVVSTWYGSHGRLLGDSHAEVTAIFVHPDGSVWMGGDGGGVDIVWPDRNEKSRLAPQDGQPQSALPKSAVLSIASDTAGKVFIGTAKGLYWTGDHGHSVARMNLEGSAPNSLIRALSTCTDGLWVGGTDGLRHVDFSSQQAKASIIPELRGSDVLTINCAKDGSLWIGTPTGLLRYIPTTGRVERPWQESSDHIGLPSGRVTAVQQDKRGRLWVAYYGAGVRILEPDAKGASGRVLRITHDEGLQNDAANALLLDKQGHAWVSTDNGILRIDRDSLTTTLFREPEGVGLLPYWTSAAGATAKGDLLFGGSGLTIVRPNEYGPRDFHAPIILTQADGQSVTSNSITLDSSRRVLQVTFALLDYATPERTRYAYRLAGLEDAWTDSPAELRLARYTNLPPGDYRLEVRASNRPSLWTTSSKWAIHVVPSWYETVTFKLIASVLFVMLLAALMHTRTRLLRHRAAALTMLVDQRTLELRQHAEQLEHRTNELRRSEQQLQQLAYFDGLTGLANRRYFNDQLQRLIAHARRGTGFVLLLVDLDRFKSINDEHGHDAGDVVLSTVSARLRLVTREVDILARLGGDEFAVLLCQPGDRDSVSAVCERMLKTLVQPIRHGDLALEIGASIGIARCPHDVIEAQALYKAADVALYAAKSAGRGTWRWADLGTES